MKKMVFSKFLSLVFKPKSGGILMSLVNSGFSAFRVKLNFAEEPETRNNFCNGSKNWDFICKMSENAGD